MGHGIDPTSPLPRYYQIYQNLSSRMTAGEFSAGDLLPSERTIAEYYGVARLTVVKALDLLEQEGRISKQQGRGSVVLPQTVSQLKSIAYLKAGLPLHRELEGMSRVAYENNYQLQLLVIDMNVASLEPYLATCIANGVKGFMVYARTDYSDVAMYQQFIRQGIAIVLVDRYYPGLDADVVVFDDDDAAFQITSRLIARGHQRIAIIPGPELQATSVQGRLDGYRRALKKHGLSYDEDLLWPHIYTNFALDAKSLSEGRYRKRLWDSLQKTRPTAVITINDFIYEHLSYDLKALELEQHSPDVTGGLELATFSYRSLPEHESLTLLALQPGEPLGQMATKLLIERLEGGLRPKGAAPQHIKLPMTILEPHSHLRVRKEARLP